MSFTIDLNPEQEARIDAVDRQRGVEPADLVRQLLAENLPITGKTAAEAARRAMAPQEVIRYITPQNLIEFRALATRPVAANGLGMTPSQASVEAQRIEALFPLAPASLSDARFGSQRNLAVPVSTTKSGS